MRWPFCALFLSAVLAAQPSQNSPAFSDELLRSGIQFRHFGNPTPDKYLIETMGGGVALLDYDNDGRLDIFLVNGGAFRVEKGRGVIDRSKPEYWNRLYHNNGDGTFTDVTRQAGLSGDGAPNFGMGVAVGDYNNDGFPDLYLTSFGRNVLYRNNRNGSFTDVTEKAGVAAGGWSVSAGFLDYDNDGHLDLFVGRYLDWDFSKHVYCGESVHTYCPPGKHAPITNVLYRNNGDGTFTDVSQKSGIAKVPGKAMGLAFNDYDGDGFTDIFVSNDGMGHFLYHNEGNGTFTEQGLTSGAAYNENGIAVSGMGVAFADYNNDGLPDILVTDLARELYELYRNIGSRSFVSSSRMSNLARISALQSGWGVQFIDYDNDGWKDILASQGHVIDNIELFNDQMAYRLPPLLARNTGGRFMDVSGTSGPAFQDAFAGRGVAVGDLNNDGAVDAVISALNGPPRILYNSASKSPANWITIKLAGTLSNRDGQGAVIKVNGGSLTQWGYASTTGSYLSAHDPRVHFGLGAGQTVARIEIHWPSGIHQVLENVKSNQFLTVTEPRKGK